MIEERREGLGMPKIMNENEAIAQVFKELDFRSQVLILK